MDADIASMRAFNRFYTRFAGILGARFLNSAATVTEARVLFEIALTQPVCACHLQERLSLDAGYLSRLLTRFEKHQWIVRARAEDDGRARPMHIAPAGQIVLDEIGRRHNAVAAKALGPLPPLIRSDLRTALATIRTVFDRTDPLPLTIRTLQPGDLGLIASRQSRFYNAEHGWGRPLEALILKTITDFSEHYKPDRDEGWIAELDGMMAGSVLLTDEGHGTARLRLLYVEPTARSRGIGDTLIQHCIAFARKTGQTRITLWTHTILEGARRLYAKHGFQHTETATHTCFGTPVQGETWVLPLTP